MAKFGSISLAQTAVGSLLDQRAVVLYAQPKPNMYGETPTEAAERIRNETSGVSFALWGLQFKYKELFAGMADLLGADVLEQFANITGANPYGITYLDAKVEAESDLCDHPIESGALITDSSIILPISATVNVAMPTFFAEKIYEQMNKIFLDKNNKIILQTKYGVYRNLVLKGISYELTYDKIDRTIFTLDLREVQEVNVGGVFSNETQWAEAVALAEDADTVNMGSQILVRQ